MTIYKTGDVIIAPATPMAEGAIGIVRLSGEGCIRLFSLAVRGKRPLDKFRPRRFYRVEILTDNGAVIDDGLCTFFTAPNSYTGEEMVELYCHGGVFIVSKILERFTAVGARPAEPGEFTRRAFINGKLDLTQAEAISALISARSDKGISLARRALSGDLSKHLETISDRITEALAEIEAYIDFPEEELPEERVELHTGRLDEIVLFLSRMKSSYSSARSAVEGITVVIVGSPNAGKSSLFNRIIEREHAIVTPIPGTTRDALTATMPFSGWQVTFVDTAGVRETDDLIETEGIKRTEQWLENADLVLWVIDSLDPRTGAEISIRFKEKPVIAVWNKSDIAEAKEGLTQKLKQLVVKEMKVSCLAGNGVGELKEAINIFLKEKFSALAGEEPLLATERHYHLVSTALSAVERARDGIASGVVEVELVADDLHSALSALAEITGRNVTEDILNHIFSKFCIGK